jgi:hypothetical protein
MTKILDFPSINEESSFKGSDGQTWHLFEVQYEYKGKAFAFEIMAHNMNDALHRLRIIQTGDLAVNRIISKRD